MEVCMVNKKVLAVLVVITVCVTVWNIALATSYQEPTPMLELRAEPILKPTVYWNLTNPDARMLEVMADIGVFKRFPRNETTFLDQMEEHGDVWKIQYEANYYEIEALGSYDIGLPKIYPIHIIDRIHASSAVLLAGLWIAVGVVAWKKKL
jgi:hypothetical protein